MRLWQLAGFAIVLLTMAAFLLMGHWEDGTDLPTDETHHQFRDYRRCASCHAGDSLPDTHLQQDGELHISHVRCYLCHNPAGSSW